MFWFNSMYAGFNVGELITGLVSVAFLFNPAYMGLKPKHSFPAYSPASRLQNPLSSKETDTAKDKHLQSLSPPSKEIQAGRKAADQQGHGLPPLCK